MKFSKYTTVAEARRFWEHQARCLPEFRRAPSTAYYREGEQRLLEGCLPAMEGVRLLKLDVWNEVKNTDILLWLASRGVRVHAVDISLPLIREAASRFRAHGRVARFAVGNLYCLPFKPQSFDCVYTMGTIEHAPDMGRCVAEVYRVLKPGGIAIVGVPNKHDPFLRPLLVHLLNLLRLYPYGVERSLTRRELARMLAAQGFEVSQGGGILFMPGLLRMAELCLWGKARWAGRAVGYLHWPFRLACRWLPWLSRFGYLIACVGRKPS